MEGSMRDLAKYRLERAEEMLRASQINLRLGEFRTSMNRSYYAVFHAMRAANSLYSFDSTKHSGVISFFRRTFLKDGLIVTIQEGRESQEIRGLSGFLSCQQSRRGNTIGKRETLCHSGIGIFGGIS